MSWFSNLLAKLFHKSSTPATSSVATTPTPTVVSAGPVAAQIQTVVTPTATVPVAVAPNVITGGYTPAPVQYADPRSTVPFVQAPEVGNPNYVAPVDNVALDKIAAVVKSTGDITLIPAGQGGAINNIMQGYNAYDNQVASIKAMNPGFTSQQILAQLG
jgi:hypothetical protein